MHLRAKIKGNKKYSIISDHLGTPIQGYDDEGSLIWQREIDSYGNAKMQVGEAGFCNYLYQGQTLDTETGLAYNRFRYYAPEEGMYISQDPIRIAGGFKIYSYVKDTNEWIDVFGLNCSSDAKKLRENMIAAGIDEPDFPNAAHHKVMSNSTDPKMIELQQKMKDLGIDINDADNGIFLPTNDIDAASSGLPSHRRIHTNEYKQNVHDKLINANTPEEFRAGLGEIGDGISDGTLGF